VGKSVIVQRPSAASFAASSRPPGDPFRSDCYARSGNRMSRAMTRRWICDVPS
jgi:hypothetical protein